MSRIFASGGTSAGLAAICLAVSLATSACASDTHGNAALPPPPPEVEEDLSLTVDALDIRHGALRIAATMEDGSADVSMWLGPTCPSREVGRGIATRSGLAWSLSGDEVARAVECNLVVRAHGVNDDGVRVVKVASLEVSVSLVADGAERVRQLSQQTDGPETTMTFAAPSRARRLHIGGTVIGAQPEEDRQRGMFINSFTVGNDDLARSMLHRRHVSVLGAHFLATVSVGSVTLDVLDPAPEATTEAAVDGDG